MDKIGCLILNYNDYETAKLAVEALEPFESVDKIVVVDNCSSDNSFELLQQLSSDKIAVIKTEKNGGYGYGNNYGIKYMYDNLDLSYVLVANPDTIIDEKTIIALKEYLHDNKECAVVAPVQRLRQPDGKIVPPWDLNALRYSVLSMSAVYSKLFLKKKVYGEKELFENPVFKCDVIQGALFMADLEFMANDGRYDENIFLYNEEECLAQSVRQAKRESFVLTDYYYIHNHSVSISKQFSAFRVKKLQIKSRKYYIKKYFHPSIFKRFFIGLFFSYCIFETFLISLFFGK